MDAPILVEVTRDPPGGRFVESRHRGAIAVADASGALVFAAGPIGHPVCPRSALKPLQALALVETGALAALGLDDRHLALASSSHNGEPEHVALARTWADRLGVREADLACGGHPPRFADSLAPGEGPTRFHDNCSGKHLGFLSLARHLGAPIAGYERPDHPAQAAVLDHLAGYLDLPPAEHLVGADGCGAPNIAVPLAALTGAFARFAARAAADRQSAPASILSAMASHPHLIAGRGRLCTEIAAACAGSVLVKSGAEGTYAAFLPEAGLGIAIKIEDGAARRGVSEIVLTSLLEGLGALDPGNTILAARRRDIVRTRLGAPVGEIAYVGPMPQPVSRTREPKREIR